MEEDGEDASEEMQVDRALMTSTSSQAQGAEAARIKMLCYCKAGVASTTMVLSPTNPPTNTSQPPRVPEASSTQRHTSQQSNASEPSPTPSQEEDESEKELLGRRELAMVRAIAISIGHELGPQLSLRRPSKPKPTTPPRTGTKAAQKRRMEVEKNIIPEELHTQYVVRYLLKYSFIMLIWQLRHRGMFVMSWKRCLAYSTIWTFWNTFQHLKSLWKPSKREEEEEEGLIPKIYNLIFGGKLTPTRIKPLVGLFWTIWRATE